MDSQQRTLHVFEKNEDEARSIMKGSAAILLLIAAFIDNPSQTLAIKILATTALALFLFCMINTFIALRGLVLSNFNVWKSKPNIITPLLQEIDDVKNKRREEISIECETMLGPSERFKNRMWWNNGLFAVGIFVLSAVAVIKIWCG